MSPAGKRLLALALLVATVQAIGCNPGSAEQPWAAIQAPAQSFSGFPVDLIGSMSGARTGDNPAYKWSLVQKPDDSEARIAEGTNGRASLTPDRPGQYTIRLAVRQAKTAGRPADVHIEAKPWFAEFGDAARVPGPVPPVGTAWGDYNNDGRLDFYVSSLQGSHALYADRGDGTYTDTTIAAIGPVGGATGGGATGGAWGDFDNDGYLDLAVASRPGVLTLYRNLGDGRFEDADSESWDCQRPGQPAWIDYDADGRVDLFVACERGAGRSVLYRNIGGETFKDVTREAGLEASSGLDVAVGDYDNDGDPDMFAYGAAPGRLWENRAGMFWDVTSAVGIQGEGDSSAAAFFDLDNDGDLDIYVVNNDGVLFLNAGNRVFSDATAMAGAAFKGPAQRVAPEDLDEDGDLDLVLVDASGRERSFRNDLANDLSNSWLTLNLEGTKSNRFGIGARVEVTTTDGSSHTAWAAAGPRSRVQGPMALHFGLGKAVWANVRVTWPRGIVQDFWSLRPNRTFLAREAVLTW